jgi:hypothetical protein
MKITNLIMILLIVAAVGATVFWVLQPEGLKVRDVKIEDNTNPFKISIVYPQIDGMDDFNKKVQDIISKEENNFKANSLANDEAVKKIDPASYAKYPREYDLNITYTKGEVDKNIVSVVFEEYNFEGGAHGETIFIPLNYDVNKKSEIKLADLFVSQGDYLKKISDFCITDLKKQLKNKLGSLDGTWIEQGAGPDAENYSVFLINPKSIIFYFPQYQVAFGAAGDFQVAYPR